jgi:antitoxin YefM
MTVAMTVTDAKARLSELVANVASTHDRVEITRNGEPAAVLMSHHEYDSLRETIAILSDAGAIVEIREAEADIAAGRLTDASELGDIMAARRRQAGA